MKKASPHPNKSEETVPVTEIEEGRSREVVKGLLLLCAELLCHSLSCSSRMSHPHLRGRWERLTNLLMFISQGLRSELP